MSSSPKKKFRTHKQSTSTAPTSNTMPARTRTQPLPSQEFPPIDGRSGYQALDSRTKYVPKEKNLLIINPNTSTTMTDLIYNMLVARGGSFYNVQTYTARDGPASINSDVDCYTSSDIVIQEIEPILRSGVYDAFLVACYSVHPLVSKIREMVHPAAHVIGIFEASVTMALSLLPNGTGSVKRSETFGIVSTGSIWNPLLTKGVADFLGNSHKFRGVETTGLTAAELHQTDPGEVKQKVMDATRRLLREKNCTVVCLGCAGMVGMEEIVREAIVAELGHDTSKYVRIVDPVKAGLALLESMELTIPATT